MVAGGGGTLSIQYSSTSTRKPICGGLEHAGAVQSDWQQIAFEDHGGRYLPTHIAVEHRQNKGSMTKLQEPDYPQHNE